MRESPVHPSRRGDPFSYLCNACGRCCRAKRIQTSPFEIATLARFLGVSTGEFIRRFSDREIPVYLRWRDDKQCIFFDPARGCTVHPARPLVCRLYPLGRKISRDETETFTSMTPHPLTEGVYGSDGTVADWIRAQGADVFIEEADRYYRLYLELVDRLNELKGEATETMEARISWDLETHWLDVDQLLAVHSARTGIAEPSALLERTALHRRILEEDLGLDRPEDEDASRPGSSEGGRG